MFNLIFQGTQAYNQAGFFLAAIACVGLGAFILGNALYWRLHAHRTSGTIIGVVASGGSYVPVCRYTLPDGQTHLAKSNMGSSSSRGKETGRIVPLMISASNPSDAQPLNNYLFDAIGLLLFALGIWLAYIALTAYPITVMTWIIAIGMLIYLAERGYRTFIPRGQRLSLTEWRKQRQADQPAIDPADVKPIESLVSATQVGVLQQQRAQNSKLAIPLLLVFAAILLAVGVYQSVEISRLEVSGLRAQGEVVRLKEEYSSGDHGGHYSYYPVVQVRLSQNSYFEFKDATGSNPPSYRRGDKVAVLYLAENPQHSAMIDRGPYWNWAIPVFIFSFAALLILILVSTLRSRRSSALPLTKAAV